MVLLASRSSTYAALGIQLLIACYTSTFKPVVFAEDISCSSFAARRLLYAGPFMLLRTVVYTADFMPYFKGSEASLYPGGGGAYCDMKFVTQNPISFSIFFPIIFEYKIKVFFFCPKIL